MGNDRDLNRTRRLLLKAALTEFAAKGLAGARTDAIARRAGVDERMIYYCFKTKEGLYREVLRSKLAEEAHIVDSNEGDDFATASSRKPGDALGRSQVSSHGVRRAGSAAKRGRPSQ